MSENRKDICYSEGALRILEALGAVDEELLERCGAVPEPMGSTEKTAGIMKYRKYRRRRKPLWKMGRAWAACLGLLAVGFVSWNGLKLIAPKGTFDSAGNTSGGAMNQNQSISAETSTEGAAYEERTGDSADTAGGVSPGETESFDGAQACDDQGSDEIINRESETVKAQDPYTQETQKEDDFGKVSDISAVKSVTEEEARSWVPLGAYLPQNLPEGYRMESAYINPEEQSVTMTWSRGMDHIMISVSSIEPGTVETVDISKPETYDERLYEIPYAETVPAEYREIFNNPVFAKEDLSLEVVSSRLISYNDSGDTDTPRGNFGVLYPDGILLYFNGRGTPEEIRNMLDGF